MTDTTKYNIPYKSNNNQRTHDVDNSNISKDTEVLEDIMQKMDYINSKPQVEGTLIPSYCQEVKKYCKLLITWLPNSSSPGVDAKAKDADKTNNTYNDVKSKMQGIRKEAYKLFDKVYSEKPSDPSLVQELQDGLKQLSKEVKKLYKFVVDNLKKLAVKVGIREETILEKGLGFINSVRKEATHTIDKAANSSIVKGVVDKAADIEVNTSERFSKLVGRQQNAHSKNKNAHSKSNNNRSRSK